MELERTATAWLLAHRQFHAPTGMVEHPICSLLWHLHCGFWRLSEDTRWRTGYWREGHEHEVGV